EVYDILGREVQTLVDAPMSAGEHEVIFNGSGLPSGVYIYTLKVNEFSQSRKMLLLK
ncbi:MAG: T9SS type A sorting domain-containing protein, partial [Bacteroidetes bacterium]|nr:T9SS type A sorting domain-containing protein [Bacteroidota bacterium]